VNDVRAIGPGRRFLIHFTIHVVLVLLYFLPGGLIWNRIEPLIFGLPFGIFMWWILLPALVIINMALFVRGHWAQDKLVTSEVRRGVTVHAAEVGADEHATGGEGTPTRADEGRG
jgi:hypothetical protein